MIIIYTSKAFQSIELIQQNSLQSKSLRKDTLFIANMLTLTPSANHFRTCNGFTYHIPLQHLLLTPSNMITMSFAASTAGAYNFN